MKAKYLNSHIELIYDSACSPQGWQPMLEQLISDLGCRSGSMAVERHQQGNFDLLSRHSHGCSEDESRIVVEYVNQIDEWKRSLWKFKPNSFYISEALLPERSLQKTEFYNVFCKPFGVYNATGCILQCDRNTALRISFLNSTTKAKGFSKQVDYLNQLAPHFARAAGIRQNLLEANAKLESATHIVDSQSLPAILVDEHCKLHYCNAQAEELFRSHRTIQLKHDKVMLRGGQTNAFAHQIYNTVMSAQGNYTPPASHGFLVKGDKTCPSIELLIQPITTAQTCFGMNFRKVLALIYLRDTGKIASIDRLFLKEVLDLTPKEQELVCLLTQGLNLKAISALQKKSLNTLKTQLNSVFQKTNTNSQAQLVLRISNSLATNK